MEKRIIKDFRNIDRFGLSLDERAVESIKFKNNKSGNQT